MLPRFPRPPVWNRAWGWVSNSEHGEATTLNVVNADDYAAGLDAPAFRTIAVPVSR